MAFPQDYIFMTCSRSAAWCQTASSSPLCSPRTTRVGGIAIPLRGPIEGVCHDLPKVGAFAVVMACRPSRAA